MRACVVTPLVVLAAIAGRAHADSPKLAAARRAIVAVHYDEAQALLVGALEEGGNSPTAVAEIYRLSARTAVVLHQPDLAEQYYRRWLALQPDARLPDDLAPKLREPFVAAQAYMAAHGRLAVTAARLPGAVDVAVQSDPLEMVAGAALAGGIPAAAQPFGADHHARLPLRAGANVVAILDEHGNHLLEVPVPAAAPPVAVTVAAPPPAASRAQVPLVRQPLAWAIPAVVLAGAGVGFGLAANQANDELAQIASDSSNHFYGDATAVRDRRDTEALAANALWATGAACAVTALVMLAIHPHARVVAAPTAARGGAGLAVTVAW